MNKYRNKKTVIDDITFDSKREASRYKELKLMEKLKLIKDLELQPKFVLQEKYVNADGKKIRAINYIADFAYYKDKKYIIIDVKGIETPVFKLKRKLFENIYPYVIRIVK